MKKLTALLVALAAAATSSAALAEPVATKRWFSGFEWEGIAPPGEFNYMDSLYVPPTQTEPDPGQNSAWTWLSAAQAPGIIESGHAYKGWITAAQDKSHRPYPSLDMKDGNLPPIPGPVIVNQWKVYHDADNKGFAPGTDHWVHFASLSNVSWYTNLIRLNVDNGKLVTAGGSFKYVGPTPQPDLPTKKWITFTIYMDFQPGGDQTWHIWQDDTHVFEWKAPNPGGTDLKVAHWGLYAGKNVDGGSQYNDDIALWSLSEPLTSFDAPPPNPYAPAQGEGGSGGGGAGGAGGMESAGGAGGMESAGGAGGEGGSGDAGAGGEASGCGGDHPDDPQSGAGCSVAPGPRQGSSSALALGALVVAALAFARRRR